MSAPVGQDPSPRAVLPWVLVALFVLVFLVCGCGFTHPILVLYTVIAGVFTYPASVLPRVEVSGQGLVLAGASLAAVAVGLHSTARWWWSARQPEAPWRAKWSALGLALFVLTFAVAIDVAASVHQLVWLWSAPHKSVLYDTYRDSPRFDHELCRSIAKDRHKTAAEHLFDSKINPRFFDTWEVEIVTANDGTPVDVMLRARDPRHAFAGTVFTCSGSLDPEAAAALASARAASPPPASAP